MVILAREARFWHQKSLFRKFDFFSDLSVFWSIFREIRSKSQKFIFKFFKNFYFFCVFYNARAFLTTWMIEWTLQNINRSIRLAESLLEKSPCAPQPSQKIHQKPLLECSYAITTLLGPPIIFDGRQLLSWRSQVKSQPFPRKSQKSRKNVKNHDFSKNFDFCDFWLL